MQVCRMRLLSGYWADLGKAGCVKGEGGSVCYERRRGGNFSCALLVGDFWRSGVVRELEEV